MPGALVGTAESQPLSLDSLKDSPRVPSCLPMQSGLSHANTAPTERRWQLLVSEGLRPQAGEALLPLRPPAKAFAEPARSKGRRQTPPLVDGRGVKDSAAVSNLSS